MFFRYTEHSLQAHCTHPRSREIRFTSDIFVWNWTNRKNRINWCCGKAQRIWVSFQQINVTFYVVLQCSLSPAHSYFSFGILDVDDSSTFHIRTVTMHEFIHTETKIYKSIHTVQATDKIATIFPVFYSYLVEAKNNQQQHHFNMYESRWWWNSKFSTASKPDCSWKIAFRMGRLLGISTNCRQCHGLWTRHSRVSRLLKWKWHECF